MSGIEKLILKLFGAFGGDIYYNIDGFYKILRSLPPREELILRMHFGIDREKYSLDKIGRDFGLSRERIRQLEHRALKKMGHSERRGEYIVIK